MREYKFRGWDAVGKKGWVYGDLVHNKKVTKTGLENRVMVGGYEVDPESVGIDTGFVDYIGKPIYEGDKVRVHIENESHEGVIVYYRYYGCFVFQKEDDETKRTALFGIAPCQLEVIGNMYQNK